MGVVCNSRGIALIKRGVFIQIKFYLANLCNEVVSMEVSPIDFEELCNASDDCDGCEEPVDGHEKRIAQCLADWSLSPIRQNGEAARMVPTRKKRR